MRMINAWFLPCLFLACGLGNMKAVAEEVEEADVTVETGKTPPPKEKSKAESDVRAHYLITVTNDYIVEAYKNGVVIPDAQRELLLERFGATAEKIIVEVRDGDWLVFHVVHNHLRWGGAKYFAVAGCLAENKFGFVSDPASSQWSACDDPGQAADYVRLRDYGAKTRASVETNPWSEGDPHMRTYAGKSFAGKALWGQAPSTWVKFLVEAPAGAPAKAQINVYLKK